MSERLNRKYELNHFSFRNGFYSWNEIAEKDIYYLEFRNIVDNLIRKIEDSISLQQDQFISRTKDLIKNVENMAYTEFKNSINKIPAEYPHKSNYYITVVREISKNKKEYVISLYKDFPGNRELIELAVDDDRALRQKLKDIRKNEFNVAKKSRAVWQ